MKVISSLEEAKKYIYGGAFLGGGGGGSIGRALETAELALKISPIEIYDPGEIDLDSTVITVSAVGVQSKGWLMPWHFARAVELLQSLGVDVDYLISSECGAFAVINGWIQSAILGIPVLDCPCDGRAHPTGVMGSMGLHKIKDYISIQAAVGGDPRRNRASEIIVTGKLDIASRMIRMFSVEVGGVVAVARNPIDARYAVQNGAPRSLDLASKIGSEFLSAGGGGAGVKAALKVIDGEVVCTGTIRRVKLESRGGFDVGSINIESNIGDVTIDFINEYMTIEVNGERIATFPDLINIFRVDSGLPLNSAEVREGMKVMVGRASASNIILGGGLKHLEVYEPIERSLGKEVRKHVEQHLKKI